MAIGDMQLTVIGNLTTDPELRFTQQGVAVAQFVIAVNPKEKGTDGKWTDGEPSFVRVECWRQLAENACESLSRGMRVIAYGRWREERWEKDGQKQSAWRLTADSVGPDLNFATARVVKAARQNGQAAPDDPWAGASRTRPAAPTSGGQA